MASIWYTHRLYPVTRYRRSTDFANHFPCTGFAPPVEEGLKGVIHKIRLLPFPEHSTNTSATLANQIRSTEPISKAMLKRSMVEFARDGSQCYPHPKTHYRIICGQRITFK